MKLSPRFKAILYATLLLLYGSGVLVWVLRGWFQRDRGFGPEPPASALYWLKAHGVAGLFFFALLGALSFAHVPKGWRARRRRSSGGALYGVLFLLSLSVPFLYYISDEASRGYVALAHTYVGLLAALPFLLHLKKTWWRGS